MLQNTGFYAVIARAQITILRSEYSQKCTVVQACTATKYDGVVGYGAVARSGAWRSGVYSFNVQHCPIAF